MDLQTTLLHMKGKTVSCNGTPYTVDSEGVARNVKAEDAQRLLGSPSWQVYSAPAPGKAAKTSKTGKKPTGKAKPAESPQEPAATPSGPPPPATPPEAPQEPENDAKGEAGEPGEPGGEENGTQWPDPTMRMGKAELHEIAEAYSVPFTDETTKQELVDSIMKAMYD